MDDHQFKSNLLETTAASKNNYQYIHQNGTSTTSLYNQPFSSSAHDQSHDVTSLKSISHVCLLCEDKNIRGALRQFLEKEGFHVTEASLDKTHNYSSRQMNKAVPADSDLNTFTSEKFFLHLKRFIPDVPVIMVDGIDSLPESKDFCLQKSFSDQSNQYNQNDLLHDLQSQKELPYENRQLHPPTGMPTQKIEFHDSSPQYELICKKVHNYAHLDEPILLIGEQGVGKGMIVRKIHMSGSRSRHPLIIVPCDSFPSQSLESMLFGHIKDVIREEPFERTGVLEIADNGTVCLDKINEMPLQIQAKICQFLKDGIVRKIGGNTEKAVNTRIIATSNNDLSLTCLHGLFHEELYSRLNSMSIHILPLRERIEDIPSYARSLLTCYANHSNTSLPILSHTAITKLQQYSWPGNIPEFKKVIYHACHIARNMVINEDDIMFDSVPHGSRNVERYLGLAGMTMAEIERRAIIETIHACGGNRAESARQLGISEKTIYNKFRRFKLKGII